MTEQVKIGRRGLLKGLAGVPLASLPLAMVLADPLIARAVAAGLSDVTTATGDGRTVRAALALPSATPAPAVLLVHEWWGLNDQIKSMAAELAKEGYVALAVDLYDGNVTSNPDQARTYMGAVAADQAQATLAAWAAWLRDHETATGKIGTVGWCFGGGWSLNASLLARVDATVIYYGSVAESYGGMGRSIDDLAALNGPVLGHYATEDQWINRAMVTAFEARMSEAGKAYTSHWYEANHAFANPTQQRYDEADARLAWQRTLAFYGEQLAG